jgi:hypothetical protein
VETHAEVFAFVLEQLAEHDLVKGKTIGVAATTLEANAAMKGLVRRSARIREGTSQPSLPGWRAVMGSLRSSRVGGAEQGPDYRTQSVLNFSAFYAAREMAVA